MTRYIIYKNNKGQFKFRFVNSGGQILAVSTDINTLDQCLSYLHKSQKLGTCGQVPKVKTLNAAEYYFEFYNTDNEILCASPKFSTKLIASAALKFFLANCDCKHIDHQYLNS